MMRLLGTMIAALVLLWLPACSSTPKVKLRSPLAVGPNVPQAVSQLTLQGTRAYEKGHVEEAKVYFEQAVAGAPNSAEAHYNVGLALFALGETDQAREQFIEAANLAPGNKVIWDSPALRPFGSPDPTITKQTKEQPYSTQRPTFGGGPRR
ncbi:MAG: tetratricopeptide repeat protein [Nitrospirota bacterium]